MNEPDYEIVFDDLSPILNDLKSEDREKLRHIFNNEQEIRVIIISSSFYWKCPRCYVTDRTTGVFCSQNEIDEYKKNGHKCPKCYRYGIEINMALIRSSK